MKNNISKDSYFLIGIVASAGGPSTLKSLFTKIRNDIKTPIIVSQHMPDGFKQGLVDWLKSETGKSIKTAENGELIKKGRIYFPPDGFHIEVKGKRIVLSNSPPVKGIRPSGDLLLKSLAKSFKDKAIGIVLTGMGSDGTEGMKNIFKVGGTTIAQTPRSAKMLSMPENAISSGSVKYIFTLDEIADFLSKLEGEYESINCG